MVELTDDRLREIVAAAEALHREEWGFVDSDEDNRILIVRSPNDAVVASSEDYKRASFIADCQPATVAALASELLKLREAVKLVMDYRIGDLPILWPWAASLWKPSDARRNLVKAGALILAEIERLDRAALSHTEQGETP